jgi:hypothetical protein
VSLCFNWALRHEGILGSGGIAPRILDLGTRWRWVVSASRPRRFTPQGKSPYPGTHWIGCCVGPRDDLEAVVNTWVSIDNKLISRSLKYAKSQWTDLKYWMYFSLEYAFVFFSVPCWVFPLSSCMICPEVAHEGDGLQVWRLAPNVLFRRSRTSCKGWSLPVWGLGVLLRISSFKKQTTCCWYSNCLHKVYHFGFKFM